MMHELLNIILQAKSDREAGLKSALATVVFLEGSFYRKPGVRMLISENGKLTSAVSGGCVEKEIARRAESVFATSIATLMKYDGRYKLGCKGILYIVIEPVECSDLFYSYFQQALTARKSLEITTYYEKEERLPRNYGSFINFGSDKKLPLSKNFHISKGTDVLEYTQMLQPLFKLIIFGGGYDASKLLLQASVLGWTVEVITTAKNRDASADFSKAGAVVEMPPELLQYTVDPNTAIVLMTHNYALDLQYLIKILDSPASYIGIIGSKKRREHLFNDLSEFLPDMEFDALEKIHSPAGLQIGAITPEEIAVSVLAEIIAFKDK